jgi:hypothetical protein
MRMKEQKKEIDYIRNKKQKKTKQNKTIKNATT